MDPSLSEFLGEAEDLTEMLHADLQLLRTGRDDGRVRRELVARIFRHVHTLKGSSTAFELPEITKVTHEFESLLDDLRSGRMTLNETILDTFDEAINVISQSLRSIAAGQRGQLPKSLIARLRDLVGGEFRDAIGTKMSESVIAAMPNDITDALRLQEKHQLIEAVEEGSNVFVVEADFDIATFDTEFKELSDALSSRGEIVSTQPGAASSADDKICFRVVYATQESAPQIRERLARIGKFELKEFNGESNGEADPSANDTSNSDVNDRSAQMSIAPLTSQLRIERVAFDEIIATIQRLFSDTMKALERSLPAQGDAAEVRAEIGEIRHGFQVLETRLTDMCMAPLSQFFERAIRAGSVAAREAGKVVDFESSGGENRVDRALSESIASSLLHILRNAVDHGIESSEERMSSGKNPRGLITIEALVDAESIRIKVTDDGLGIDCSRVVHAARNYGFIDQHSEISDDESLRLIFRPGLSTADMVSEVSGRGVGLDIVERALADVGGQVLVRSKSRVGTTFELIIPNMRLGVPVDARPSEGHSK